MGISFTTVTSQQHELQQVKERSTIPPPHRTLMSCTALPFDLKGKHRNMRYHIAGVMAMVAAARGFYIPATPGSTVKTSLTRHNDVPRVSGVGSRRAVGKSTPVTLQSTATEYDAVSTSTENKEEGIFNWTKQVCAVDMLNRVLSII